MARQIILDTETTGINSKHHKIVEIGCVELIDRKPTGNNYHVYINPDMDMEQEVIDIHGLTNEYLADKPRFHEIAQSFYEFIRGAELVIHNAPFDIGFMDKEFSLLGKDSPGKTAEFCTVLDTLLMAREKHPGQKNSLDALCKRYFVDNSMREKHGALLDAEILAEVYLAMTGGQRNLWGGKDTDSDQDGSGSEIQKLTNALDLASYTLSDEEQQAHDKMLQLLDKKSDGAIWHRYNS